MAGSKFNYEIARNPGARFRQLGMGGQVWRDMSLDASWRNAPKRAARWTRRGTGRLVVRFGDWVARVGSALVGGE